MNDLTNSGTTKASGTVASSLGSNFESMKISLQGSSATGSAHNQKISTDKGNLTVIEEEIMVAEGCDNELERSRQTIQGIRQSRRLGLSTVPEEAKNSSSNTSTSKSKSQKGSKSAGSKSDPNNSQDAPMTFEEEMARKEYFIASTGEDLFGSLEKRDDY